ncbi:hypothetical protein DL764_004281 [Monosporascus ibericus]|uniref:Putative gamma-glutamylcyclotransferase n=1 Tax=Monosporascus ibericus TaxID=155417 RepID=A0A4Q4TDB3_9PEZI|nr:hypothetical protein DL764_004281 [Monosporascus ibericus]
MPSSPTRNQGQSAQATTSEATSGAGAPATTSGAVMTVNAEPLAARHPVTFANPEDQKRVEADNARILALRGYKTTATDTLLWQLACRAEGGFVLGSSSSSSPSRRRRHLGFDIEENNVDVVFEPFHFFFYGSLQDPGQIRRVCGLDASALPAGVLQPATIRGWRVKMWGPFPALVPADAGAEVRGVVWKCEVGAHVSRLCFYETDNYRLEFVDIKKDDGEVVKDGRTFVHAGDPADLEEGSFNLAQWRDGRTLSLF